MRLMTTAEAAAYLGISQPRVRLLCRTGRIKAQLAGKTYVMSESALRAFAAIPRRTGRPRKDGTR